MAVKSTESSRHGPKGDKRDRTRATLLEAARAMVREKGYARTTLEAVARRAGMTTGAIYGNFKNRDELFIALGQTYWAPVIPRIKPGATFAEVMRAMAEATLEAIPERTTAACFQTFKRIGKYRRYYGLNRIPRGSRCGPQSDFHLETHPLDGWCDRIARPVAVFD